MHYLVYFDNIATISLYPLSDAKFNAVMLK